MVWSVPDGQGIVVVGLVPQGRRDEAVPGHLPHGRQHPGVGHPPGRDLPLHHLVAHGGVAVFSHGPSSSSLQSGGRKKGLRELMLSAIPATSRRRPRLSSEAITLLRLR